MTCAVALFRLRPIGVVVCGVDPRRRLLRRSFTAPTPFLRTTTVAVAVAAAVAVAVAAAVAAAVAVAVVAVAVAVAVTGLVKRQPLAARVLCLPRKSPARLRWGSYYCS
jgi:hypothetical protein